ncbi:papain family cysteine protease (macronuclear) [Tetrahymena thermophila SB210]|uniref:Papain family cysteine protease n=1 Tax=Tetrahymena thermophila (strain SB210) TaxID=312017 RepID=Q23GZ3_TETTS|nr:papain family cysteine protease [Tetrahymena thermophila SB210]EAR95854.1 papain family cysteine protease [Tetrahymena thermophila SB210]|eukprot:XP_001016099.1 papain family cysteine protease [Tetrahymena thermophila SB210]
MNKKFIILSIIMLMPLCLTQDISVEQLLAHNKWSSQNQRVYLNDDEKLYRQTVFFDNLQKIKEHNSNPNKTYSVRLNQFSDMTREEFVEKILMKQDLIDNYMKGNGQYNNANNESQMNSQNHTLAASIDWRKKGAVTSVKNQGGCGSCWAFSAAGLMESFNFIQNKTLIDLSEQQLVDCVIPANGYPSRGCDGGWPANCLDYASKVGITTFDKYPYYSHQYNCTVNVKDTNNGFKLKKWIVIPNTSNDLKSALNFSPVSVRIDASSWGNYDSGIFNGCNQSQISLNHAVLAIGYDEKDNWIVKNSWGPAWGENGYMRLAPNNTCGILSSNVQITA